MISDSVKNAACYLLLPAVSLYCLLEAPFANVEERFMLNTAFDFANGTPYEEFHHIKHPHVVPRTIIPSLILALVAKPMLMLGFELMTIQIVLRAIVALPGILAHYYIARTLGSKYGTGYMRGFLLVSACQAKITYYISRTYPNILAQNFMIPIWGCLLNNDYLSSVKIICYVAIIIRSEVALFLAPLCLGFLYTSGGDVLKLLKTGIVHCFTALVITVVPDTLFWKHWGKVVWPELVAFIFNVVDKNSNNWGEMEWYYYYERIPIMLKTPYPLLIVLFLAALVTKRNLIYPFICGAFFIVVYSSLPHKEERFVTYTLPLWTILIVVGANVFWNIQYKMPRYLFRAVAPIVLGMMFWSSEKEIQFRVADYVGGIAARKLSSIVPKQNLSILIHEHCIQHGATIFALPNNRSLLTFELMEDNPSHHIKPGSWVEHLFGNNCRDCYFDPELTNPQNYDIYLTVWDKPPPNEDQWVLKEKLSPVDVVSLNVFSKIIPDIQRRTCVQPVSTYFKKSSLSKFNIKDNKQAYKYNEL